MAMPGGHGRREINRRKRSSRWHHRFMTSDLAKLKVVWDAEGVAASIQENICAAHARGELLGEREFIERAGMSHEALEAAVQERRMLRVEMPAAAFYAAFYLDPSIRQELELVTQLLGDANGGSKMLFFSRPRGSLATEGGGLRTPLQALRDGDLEVVKRAAAGLVER